MKKTIFLILAVLICINFISASVCDDDNNILVSNIPCEMITPTTMQCSTNATIIYLSDTSINKSVGMTVKNASLEQYNLTFDYTTAGFYSVDLCNDLNAIILVSSPNETLIPDEYGYGAYSTSISYSDYVMCSYVYDFIIN